jgi:hypothetical protein
MNARSLTIALTLLAILPPAPADEKKLQPTNSALITRVHHGIYRAVFLESASNGVKKPNDEFPSKPLPPTRSGLARYEVTERLIPYGLKAVPGSSAIFLEKENALVLTTSAEMQELADRIFFGVYCGDPKHCEVSVTLVEFNEYPLSRDPHPCRSMADIKAVAADSLRVVDAVCIVTKSGQRTIGINKEATTGGSAGKRANPENKEAKPNKTEMELAGSLGSLIEVEPVIGPSGSDIDMQIRYEGRFSKSDTRPDAEFKVNTNLMVPSGQDIVASMSVVHDAQDVPKEKIRRRALLVCARVVSPDGRTTDERRLADEAFLKARDENLIREATEGLEKPKK